VKRDMDLIRQLLLKIEESSRVINSDEIQIEEADQEHISYHLELLLEAKLIVGIDASGAMSFELLSIRLTWEGHEFLDAARNEKRWGDAKAMLSGIEAVGFEMLKAILIDAAKKQLGIS